MGTCSEVILPGGGVIIHRPGLAGVSPPVLGGFGGTPFDLAGMPAAPEPMGKRAPAVRSIQPFFTTGDAVKSLVFTGRGYLVGAQNESFATSATALYARFSQIIPFRGFVRTLMAAANAGGGNTRILPVWSKRPETTDGAFGAFPVGSPMASITDRVVTPTGLGMLSIMNTNQEHFWPINFLLPEKDVCVGVWIHNANGSSIFYNWSYEVLEVAENPG